MIDQKHTNVCAALALFSALLFLPLPAIVLGIVGNWQASQRIHETGEGMAWFAVLLGIFEVVGWIILAIMFDQAFRDNM